MGSVFQRRPVLVVTVTSKCYTYILFFFFLSGKAHHSCKHVVRKKGGQDASIFQIRIGAQDLH